MLKEAFAVEPLYIRQLSADGSTQGVLPMYISRSLIAGHHISTLDGGALAVSKPAASSLLLEARDLAKQRRVGHLLIRGGLVPSELKGKTQTTVWPILDLEAGLDHVWDQFSRKMRHQIRRALPLPLELTEQNEIPPTFYTHFAQRQLELGTPTVSPRFFEAINRHFGPKLHFLGLQDHHELVGGMVCLRMGRELHSLFAAVDRKYQQAYANYLLYWRILEWAFEQDIRAFHFGRSAPGSGSHEFKKKWRGEDRLMDYQQVAITPESRRPRLDSRFSPRGTSELVTRAWRWLPRSIANRIGPLVRRQIPFG